MVYEQPRHVDKPQDCFFYHRTGRAELESQSSDWDLTDCVDEYLGKLDYSQQRVLDVGTASGYLSFELEKRGAEVVSFDMPSAANWDLVPHYSLQKDLDNIRARKTKGHKKLQNAYWYLHGKLNSSAKVHYGDVYRLPVELGQFDVVFMGMILGHLRDPFQAIYSASRLCKNKIVITNQAAPKKPSWFKKNKEKKNSAMASFMPSRENVIGAAWWALSTDCIAQMLGTLGFEVVETIESEPKCLVKNRVGKETCVTIVAERFAGSVAGLPQQAAA